MTRCCELTGVGVQAGNNVSHSNRKTRRRFLPNLQNVSLQSDALGKEVRVRITVSALRTVIHNGGLDAFLLKNSNLKLPARARQLKRQVEKALEAKKTA